MITFFWRTTGFVSWVIFVTLLMVWACRTAAAEKELPPRIEDLIRAGKRTAGKFRETPTSWRVRYTLPNGLMMETKVVHDRDRRAWSFAQVENGRSEVFARVVELDGVWHVIESGHKAKYRPYEAELHLPGGYLLLSLAELRCVLDESLFGSARLWPNGDLDTNFFASIPGGAVSEARLHPDGRILVAGDFRQVTGIDRLSPARLYGDAFLIDSVDPKTGAVIFRVPLGSNYILQSSDDLSLWSDIATNQASSVPITYTPPSLGNSSGRFYRVKIVR